VDGPRATRASAARDISLHSWPSLRRSSRYYYGRAGFTPLSVVAVGVPPQAERALLVEGSNATQLVGEIEPGLVDRVFTSSHKLSARAIVDFVTALCRVSRAEVTKSTDLDGRDDMETDLG
jgi:hypothetical protein